MKLFDIDPIYRKAVYRHVVAWFFFGIFTAGIAQQIGFIVGKSGGSPILVTLVTSGPAALAILSFLVVPWGRRFSAKTLVGIPRIFAALLFLAVIANIGPIGLAIIAFIAIGIFILSQLFYGRLLGQIYPLRNRGRLMSLSMFVRSSTAIGVSLFVGRLLGFDELAYRWLLPAVGLCGVASSVLLLSIPLRGQSADHGQADDSIKAAAVFRDRPYFVWTLLYSVSSVGYYIAHSAKPVFFARILFFSYWDNGVALAAFNITFCLGLVFWGTVLDRFGALRTMILSWAIMATGFGVMAVGQNYESAILGQALIGLGQSGIDISRLLVVLDFAPAKGVDRYMGLFMTLYGVRALLGGVLGAGIMQLSPTGSRTALAVACLVVLSGAVSMALSSRHYRFKKGNSH